MAKQKQSFALRAKRILSLSKKHPFHKKNILPLILSLLLFILILLTYQTILKDKYYPFTFVGSNNISLLTKGQAIRVLESSFKKRSRDKLVFEFPQGTFVIDLATSSASLNYASLDAHFKSSHEGNFWNKFLTQTQSFIFRSNISPKIILSLDKQMDVISSSIDKPYQNASLTFDEITTPEGSPSARIQIQEGENGLALDKSVLKEIISNYLLTGKYKPLLPTKSISPKVSTEKIQKAKEVLENLLVEPIKFNFQDQSWTLDTKQILALLDLETEKDTLLDKDKTYIYLQNIASAIDQEVTEGLFEFNPSTKRVTAFKQSREGRKLNIDKTYSDLIDSLINNQPRNVNLNVEIIKPKILTNDVNTLGIRELIGQGISNFAGSIPNRIYNVGLTASKINGVLIAPGDVFSFNGTVGDISATTGFKQAYVIKEGRTVLDDGGGVCQDSTTLFRAVLNAGLPIIKRTAHAYRVGYYEQGFPPGLDATVYYPSVDFQFKNDTKNYILIQAYTSGLTLYVDLYGTSDGRESSLTKPIVTNFIPAPPELRQDDPSLPKGTIKQVDWAASGAKVSFNRTVTRDGEQIIKETWNSSYKPWQAIFLIGTKE